MRQAQALSVMMRGKSVFLTGSPGAGKTYVLNKFIDLAEKAGKRVAVTASTGIAATHIGGTTIHSWSGLGIRDELSSNDLIWLKDNERLSKRYNSTDVLVIDEVSMLHGKRLDMINQACKLLRESDEPFGGLQVVLVGDLFQLPPVSRDQAPEDFAHLSETWEELSPSICYLEEQHRQQGGGLLELLEAMRSNDLQEAHQDILAERLGVEPESEQLITRLYAHNQDVDSINEGKLAQISSKKYEFKMLSKGTASKIEQLARGVLAPENLELAVGAEVMFVANNFAAGFVNGTRGQVVSFKDDLPIVQLSSGGRLVRVEPHTWMLEEDGKKRAEVSQLPLRLAWAITIHKSQGMSLDAAEIDLSRSFTPGMGYVALSRVRSLDGLYLSGINRMAMELHPLIHEFDVELRGQSKSLANETEDYEKTESKPETQEGKESYDSLLETMKKWRAKEAKKRRLPLYMIASNKTLEEIAKIQPTTLVKLKGIGGVGPKFLEKYGSDVIDIVSKELGVVKIDGGDKVGEFLAKRNIELSDKDIEELKKLLK
jgi:ATP-dependent exoDNAse (exonuclease V) alpha subunit